MLNWFNKNIFITRDILWIRLQRSIFTCCSMTAVTLLKYDDSRPDASSSEGSCGDTDRQITATGGWFYRDKFYTGWFYIGWFYRDHQTLDQFYRNYKLQRPVLLRWALVLTQRPSSCRRSCRVKNSSSFFSSQLTPPSPTGSSCSSYVSHMPSSNL